MGTNTLKRNNRKSVRRGGSSHKLVQGQRKAESKQSAKSRTIEKEGGEVGRQDKQQLNAHNDNVVPKSHWELTKLQLPLYMAAKRNQSFGSGRVSPLPLWQRPRPRPRLASCRTELVNPHKLQESAALTTRNRWRLQPRNESKHTSLTTTITKTTRRRSSVARTMGKN